MWQEKIERNWEAIRDIMAWIVGVIWGTFLIVSPEAADPWKVYLVFASMSLPWFFRADAKRRVKKSLKTFLDDSTESNGSSNGKNLPDLP